ncbi:unnamed protein product [Miscanthus lutarioriparius]|uniref:Leucine-rich repeat-containing N-terminal plant-type domain-containing protein n=1 Tax=Miscanthus lutarioriparius TaxID=422564 RepID=A0A811SG42_9POAL|nr:unnamed protein product [Miscanthus lutarioriparius]
MGIVCLGASSTLLCEEDRSNALGLVGCCDELVEVGSGLDGLDSAAGAVFPVDTVTDEAVSALVAKEVLAAAPSPSCKLQSSGLPWRSLQRPCSSSTCCCCCPSHLCPFPLALAPAGAESEDTAALLAFKAAAVGSSSSSTSGDRGAMLASWNGSVAASPCTWDGVTCGRRGRVVALRLPSLGLAGTLSPAVGNLSSLRALNLSSNWLRGEIPASLGRLRRLRTLDLSVNTLSGAVPGNLTACTSLTVLRLASNKLTGHVPAELGGALARLEVLALTNNTLTGRLPASLANLTSLRQLGLGINGFEGPIPPELGRSC